MTSEQIQSHIYATNTVNLREFNYNVREKHLSACLYIEIDLFISLSMLVLVFSELLII